MSHAAPLACDDLLRPLDQLDLHHLQGRWALVAGSLSHRPHLELFKERSSAAVNFTRNSTETNISYTRSLHVDNKCMYSTYNISLNGSSFTFDGTDERNLIASYVYTSCRDCLLMHMKVESGKRQHFYLFSRRRQLEQEEIEEFRAQVKCLNMPEPLLMDPTEELCPEAVAEDPAAPSDDKTGEQSLVSVDVLLSSFLNANKSISTNNFL